MKTINSASMYNPYLGTFIYDSNTMINELSTQICRGSFVSSHKEFIPNNDIQLINKHNLLQLI